MGSDAFHLGDPRRVPGGVADPLRQGSAPTAPGSDSGPESEEVGQRAAGRGFALGLYDRDR